MIITVTTADVHGPYGCTTSAISSWRKAHHPRLPLCPCDFSVRLMPPATTPSSFRPGTRTSKTAVYTGTGRALDPDKYFIIIVNQVAGPDLAAQHAGAGRNGNHTCASR